MLIAALWLGEADTGETSFAFLGDPSAVDCERGCLHVTRGRSDALNLPCKAASPVAARFIGRLWLGAPVQAGALLQHGHTEWCLILAAQADLLCHAVVQIAHLHKPR